MSRRECLQADVEKEVQVISKSYENSIILGFTRREAIDSDLNFLPCSQGYHKIDTLSNISNRLFIGLTSLKNRKSLLHINPLLWQY